MSKLIISVAGLRGVVGEALTPEVALRYVAAYAKQLPEGPIVVSRDGRESGKMLAQIVHAGLNAAGRATIDADIAATPTTGILVRHLGAAGGIQISASHNPRPYNGIKLFSKEGRVIPEAPGQRVRDAYHHEEPHWVPVASLGQTTVLDDTTASHLEHVLATVDVERIRARRFTVLLESNHGAGSILGQRLLEALGCEFRNSGSVPDGQFEHTPEPLAENLQNVLPSVPAIGADVGFCQDPDADRLAVIDADGRYIGEEYTLALCVDHQLRREKGPIVTNCATSRMSEDIAARYEVPLHRTAVGEANVVDGMLQHGAVFGGEGNGGPIDPQVGWVRDSFVGMARILDAMATREMTVAQLVAELPSYSIEKTKVPLPQEKVPAAVDLLESHFGDATANRMDGLRLDWPDRWLLVRASNTEPIVRAIAEGPTADAARALCREAAEVIATI